MVDGVLLLLVEDDLEDLAAILLGAEALADDLDGVDEVVEDGVVDGRQGSGTGSLLGLGGARAVGALGTGEDAARGEDQDVAVGELLLELTSEAVCSLISPRVSQCQSNCDPSLHSSGMEEREMEGGEMLTVAALGGNPGGMGRGQR